jgi:hypothetical protein
MLWHSRKNNMFILWQNVFGGFPNQTTSLGGFQTYGGYITSSSMIAAVIFMCYDIYPGIADGEMKK